MFASIAVTDFPCPPLPLVAPGAPTAVAPPPPPALQPRDAGVLWNCCPPMRAEFGYHHMYATLPIWFSTLKPCRANPHPMTGPGSLAATVAHPRPELAMPHGAYTVQERSTQCPGPPGLYMACSRLFSGRAAARR